MTREDYISRLLQLYSLVAVLSDKNNCKVLRLRNKKSGRDMILRSIPGRMEAYSLLCTVRCENLPETYDVLDAEDGQVILEEYIDGITVAQVMESGRYHYRGAKRVMLGVCNALQVLHNLEIIHRDVKPENVMVDTNGRVVLIDLNAARKETESHRDTVVMGTVGYAAPEQLGLSQSDARTDIYAAGVLFNVMLTGKHPTEAFAKGRAGKLIRKCTALNPCDRYQSAARLLDAL